MNDKNTNIRELNAENMEQVTGGDKISYAEAWTTLPHIDHMECPHCKCVPGVYMGTGTHENHTFDLMRCRACCQRYVLEKWSI